MAQKFVDRHRGTGRAQAVSPVKKPGTMKAVLYPGPSISKTDVMIFTSQLSSLYLAGINLIRGLEAMQGQFSAKWKPVLSEVRRDLTAGTSFAEALSRFPKIFPPLYIALVKSGETAGVLGEALEEMAQIYERDLDLQKRLKTAFIYPVVVLCSSLLVIAWLMIKVVPLFVKIYGSAHQLLPWPTRIVIFISHLFTQGGPYLLALTVGLAFFGLWAYRSRKGKLALDKVSLRVPILGRFLYDAAVVRFSRIMAAAWQSGLPVLLALEMAQDVLGNEYLKEALTQVRGGIQKGDTLSNQMKRTGAFSPLFIQMVWTAEQTGNLPEMLRKVAQFYEKEVDVAIKQFLAMLEPALTLFIGGIVALVAFSLYLPLFTLYKFIGR